MDQFAYQMRTGSGAVDVRRTADRDLYLFADALSSAWPMEDASSFEELLRAIDESARRSANGRPKRIEQQRD